MPEMFFALLVGDDQSFNVGRVTVNPIGLNNVGRVLPGPSYTQVPNIGICMHVFSRVQLATRAMYTLTC